MNAPAALLVAKMLIPETMAVDQRLQVNRQEIDVTQLMHLPMVQLSDLS